jgi:hypothetical protein
VKKKGAAEADVASPMPAAVIIADNKLIRNLMSLLLIDVGFESSVAQFLRRHQTMAHARKKKGLRNAIPSCGQNIPATLSSWIRE